MIKGSQNRLDNLNQLHLCVSVYNLKDRRSLEKGMDMEHVIEHSGRNTVVGNTFIRVGLDYMSRIPQTVMRAEYTLY